MGIAVNVSQNGIQIETEHMIFTEHILLMFYDYKSNFIATKGKVVYSKEDESGKFKTGIQLMGVNGDNHKFVKRLIQSYHYQNRLELIVWNIWEAIKLLTTETQSSRRSKYIF
jgi:hypothetical protein